METATGESKYSSSSRRCCVMFFHLPCRFLIGREAVGAGGSWIAPTALGVFGGIKMNRLVRKWQIMAVLERQCVLEELIHLGDIGSSLDVYGDKGNLHKMKLPIN